MSKHFVKTALATAILLATTACTDSSNVQTSASTEAAVAAAQPELGTWGVDLTAQKPAVKPGDNFFEYMNGTWLDNFVMPADRTNFGAFTVLAERSRDQVKTVIDEVSSGDYPQGSVEQKIGDYYASYMDVESVNAKGINPIKPLLDQIQSISNIDELTRAFGMAGKESMVSPVVSWIGIDRIDPDAYTVNVALGGMGLPDRDYYLSDEERYVNIRAEYQKHIAQMLGFAGINDADAKAAAILALETKLAEYQAPRDERRNRDKTYNPTSYADLKANYAGFDWDTYFGVAGINKIDELNVYLPAPLQGAIEMVNTIPLDTWKAHLAYHTISNHAGILSEEIDQANFAFFGTTLRGQQEQQARWKRGVARVGGLDALGEAIGQVYVKRHFPAEAKTEMKQLVENLRTALGQRIDQLSWMTDATKEEARKKLASFNPKIGYPDEWKDLSGLEIIEGDLYTNAKNVDYYNYQDQLDRLTKKTDRNEWFMTPQTVNAYYNSSFNEIVFPAAILQPPFFDLHADPAVNYGGIGAVIGHEMGHGFDDQGSKSDWQRVQRNWWTDEDRAAFEKLTTKLGAQYNQYEAVPGGFVDGNFTMGENIGDLGGLAMAYHAYKLSLNGEEAPIIDGLTGDQRFFMAWAQVWKRKYTEDELRTRLKTDPHSPSEYRVNGIVRNMDEWYKAFNISKDDALYLPPEERVAIW